MSPSLLHLASCDLSPRFPPFIITGSESRQLEQRYLLHINEYNRSRILTECVRAGGGLFPHRVFKKVCRTEYFYCKEFSLQSVSGNTSRTEQRRQTVRDSVPDGSVLDGFSSCQDIRFVTIPISVRPAPIH